MIRKLGCANWMQTLSAWWTMLIGETKERKFPIKGKPPMQRTLAVPRKVSSIHIQQLRRPSRNLPISGNVIRFSEAFVYLQHYRFICLIWDAEMNVWSNKIHSLGDYKIFYSLVFRIVEISLIRKCWRARNVSDWNWTQKRLFEKLFIENISIIWYFLITTIYNKTQKPFYLCSIFIKQKCSVQQKVHWVRNMKWKLSAPTAPY